MKVLLEPNKLDELLETMQTGERNERRIFRIRPSKTKGEIQVHTQEAQTRHSHKGEKVKTTGLFILWRKTAYGLFGWWRGTIIRISSPNYQGSSNGFLDCKDVEKHDQKAQTQINKPVPWQPVVVGTQAGLAEQGIGNTEDRRAAMGTSCSQEGGRSLEEEQRGHWTGDMDWRRG